MKEIAFRWIDKYLINLSIQEKFYLLFLLPLLAIVLVIALLTYTANAHMQGLLTSNMHSLELLINNSELSADKVNNILAKEGIFSVYQTGNSTLSAQYTPTFISILSLQTLLIISALLCTLSVLMYYMMSFIGGAMFSINKALHLLAKGDLVARLNYFKVRDEFSSIAINIDAVADREQKLVLAIRGSVSLMQSISLELNTSSQKSYDLSKQQQVNLDALATASEQMLARIGNVTDLALESSLKSDEVHKVAQLGQVKVEETLHYISSLNTDIHLAASAVNELESNALEIDTVLSTIRSISEQTNLLALNAAIEAARAGEQGRGFAIVANEVRALAGRTQEATIKIQSMIEALQKNTKSLTSLMNNTVTNTQKGLDLMQDVNVKIDDLSDKNKVLSTSSGQIAEYAQEQSNVAENIALSVESIREQASDVNELLQSGNHNIDALSTQRERLEALLMGLKA
ncbi:methyl-accepting chemotaxis protein [Psychromonas sp. CNPT3]|uniref:methyl-accepting chemotaxis protein n=1 Tax=Psychromonas sp. CNPT3 TaxID=314282 RepID=UPI00006E48A3|nr:methyl-accepting chemotaxis protein [Psychromonas sp. CNPT3]AGH80936.1 methyl-accepting chemotaxis protein [Psychromonas sp. CNPT3]